MKKIITTILLFVLILTSCGAKHSFALNEDGTLTMDGNVYYPLDNSYRYTDYGITKKQGTVANGDVCIVEGNSTILLVQSAETSVYYVPEVFRGFDKLLEECTEYFFVPASDLDKSGRIDRSYAEKAKRLKEKQAEDFAFYVFYGRAPEDYGYTEGVYAGEIYAVFPEIDGLVSSYPVYKYSSTDYSVVIDGEETIMDTSWAKEIGIIK